SDYGGQHTHHNQYGAPVIPLAIGASIVGFATLRVSPRLRRRLTGAVLVSAVAFSLVHGAIPFTPDFYDAYLRGNPDRAPSEGQIFAREPRYEPFLPAVAAIPLDASISSRDFFTTQLPERRLNYHLNRLDPCGAQSAFRRLHALPFGASFGCRVADVQDSGQFLAYRRSVRPPRIGG